MALTLATPPAGSLEIAHGPAAQAHLGGRRPLEIPHPVYDLGLGDLLAGRGLEAATLTGWRYVSREDDGPLRILEVAVDPETGEHRVATINSGAHTENFVALHDDGVAIAEPHHELRLIRASACYVLGTWFVATDGGADVLVPLAPVPMPFAPDVPYAEGEFLPALYGLARNAAGLPADDDLAVVEGIGPEIRAALAQVGITTFARLARATESELRQHLDAVGPRFARADPATWPEQAALAAAGRWAELENLWSRLTGGRR